MEGDTSQSLFYSCRKHGISQSLSILGRTNNLRYAVGMQWLMYNDCVYRARNTMELVMFNDRDEFINVRQRHQRFNLKHFFLEHFDKPEIASLSYWHAIYHVHCKMDKVCVLLLQAIGSMPLSSTPHAVTDQKSIYMESAQIGHQ